MIVSLGTVLLALLAVALVAGSTWLRRRVPIIVGLGLMVLETAVVTAAVFAGDPLTGVAPPAPMIFFSPAVLALLCLMVLQSTGASPWAAGWSGALALAAWTLARALTLAAPGTLSRANVKPTDHETLLSYLGAITQPYYFSQNVWLLQMAAIAGVAVVLILSALRARALVGEALQSQAARGRLAAHFAAPVVQAMLDRPREQGGEGEAPVMDCDLTGFTSAVAGLPASATARLLRAYHALVEEEVFAHGGAVLKFAGDGVTSVFGLIEPGPANPARALACAERLVALWPARAAAVVSADPMPRLVAGLDHGPVRWGIVGGERAGSLLVLGAPVDGAARLQAETRRAAVPILASERVRRLGTGHG